MRENIPHGEQKTLEPHGRCGAKTRSGEPCNGVKMANGRCRMHGGTVKRGREHPRWKHGKYSQYPDGFLTKLYYESRAAMEAEIVSES
jgi:hypothetical protein